MPVYTSDTDSIRSIIQDTKRIAVIGASSKRTRTSNRIFRYLMDQGFLLIPINPNEKEVLGHKSYDTVWEIPDNEEPDMVLIFRNAKATAGELEKIVRWSKNRDFKPVIWTQIGVSSEKAERIAEKEKFEYVKNRCLMVDHDRLI